MLAAIGKCNLVVSWSRSHPDLVRQDIIGDTHIRILQDMVSLDRTIVRAAIDISCVADYTLRTDGCVSAQGRMDKSSHVAIINGKRVRGQCPNITVTSPNGRVPLVSAVRVEAVSPRVIAIYVKRLHYHQGG